MRVAAGRTRKVRGWEPAAEGAGLTGGVGLGGPDRSVVPAVLMGRQMATKGAVLDNMKDRPQ